MKRSHSHNDLARSLGRVRASRGLPNAEADEVDLICPQCSYQGPESSFDEVEVPDTDSDSDEGDGDAEDSYKTDPITTSTQNDDDVNQRDVDKVPTWNDRVALAKAIARDLAAGANKGSKK
jgi:hypothetical protein